MGVREMERFLERGPGNGSWRWPRDPHTIGRWAAAFGEGGPAALIFEQSGGSPLPSAWSRSFSQGLLAFSLEAKIPAGASAELQTCLQGCADPLGGGP